MVVLICAGGPDVVDGDTLRELALEADLVIGCDSGARHLVRAGVIPGLVVGDFDSLPPEEIDALRSAGSLVQAHPADKDVTDLDLALAAASQRGASEIVVTGIGGGLPDHFGASLGSCARVTGARVRAVGAGWHGDVVRAGESLRVAPEAVFSVLAVGRALVSVTGARWELSGHELVPLDSLGVGNRTGEGPADMSVSEGVVWVFVRD